MAKSRGSGRNERTNQDLWLARLLLTMDRMTMDRMTIDTEALLITVRTDLLDGYPQADASEWAEVRAEFMAAARKLASDSGKPVEVQDDEGYTLEQVWPEEIGAVIPPHSWLRNHCPGSGNPPSED